MSDFINNELQAQIIEYNKIKKSAFLNNGIIKNNDNEILYYTSPIGAYPYNKEFEKILNARLCKTSRIMKHIVYGITHYSYCYFATFTFNNEYINYCERKQRDSIKIPLKENKIQYILNVDFGAENERLHYHALLFSNNPIHESMNTKLIKHKGRLKRLFIDFPGYTGGYSSIEPIGTNKEDILSLKKYIDKLANHCLKDSTKNRQIIYSFKPYQSIYYDVKKEVRLYGTKLEYIKEDENAKRLNSLENKLQYERDKNKLFEGLLESKKDIKENSVMSELIDLFGVDLVKVI